MVFRVGAHGDAFASAELEVQDDGGFAGVTMEGFAEFREFFDLD